MNGSMPKNHSYASDDYYEILCSHSPVDFLAVATFFAFSIVELLLLFGIIYYERNGRFRYRTVLNQLFSSVCLAIFLFVQLIYIPESIRFMIGPLNKTICNILVVLKRILINDILLTFDAIAILRYVFIFQMPNFAVIDDNFIKRCMDITIVMVSAWAACVLQISPGVPSITDYVCAGMDPQGVGGSTHYQDQPDKMPTTLIIIVASAILHAFVNARILYFECKNEHPDESIGLGSFEKKNDDKPDEPQQNMQNKLFNQGMVDLSTQILFFITIVVLGVLAIVINKSVLYIAFEEDAYIYMYVFKMTGLHIFVLMFVLNYYWRNDEMRQFLRRKITNLLQRSNA